MDYATFSCRDPYVIAFLHLSKDRFKIPKTFCTIFGPRRKTPVSKPSKTPLRLDVSWGIGSNELPSCRINLQ